jgi:hypothetical protein
VPADKRGEAETLLLRLAEQTAQEHLIIDPVRTIDPVAQGITSLGRTTGPGSPTKIVRDNRVTIVRERRTTTIPERPTTTALTTTRLVQEQLPVRERRITIVPERPTTTALRTTRLVREQLPVRERRITTVPERPTTTALTTMRLVREQFPVQERRITTVPERATTTALTTTRLVQEQLPVRERRKIRAAVLTLLTMEIPTGVATVPTTASEDGEYRVRPADRTRVSLTVGPRPVETRGQTILLSPVPRAHRALLTVRLRPKTGQVQTIARLLRKTDTRRLLRRHGRLRHDRTEPNPHRNVNQDPRRLKANRGPRHALLTTGKRGRLGLSNLALRETMMAETKTRKGTKTSLKTRSV